MSTNITEATMGFFTTPRPANHTAYSQEVVMLISISAGMCSLITVVGNAIVIMSFFINKSLRNFSNYMILSLAFSDFTIGAFSMNVFTTYNVHKSWILGPAMCKAWLSVDYTASNASVMNLLVICVDRYLAITKPVKYRRWCTPRHAAAAITGVWSLSFLMWVPPIVLWDVVSENATLPPGACYIPFINDSPLLSVATIIGAFYFPAVLMCALYQRVIHKIRRRRTGIRSIIRGASASMAGKNLARKVKSKNQCFSMTSRDDNELRAVAAGGEPLKSRQSEDATAKENLLSVYKVIKKRDSIIEYTGNNTPCTSSTAQSRISVLEPLREDKSKSPSHQSAAMQITRSTHLQRTLSLRVPDSDSKSRNNYHTKSRSISYTMGCEDKEALAKDLASAREAQRTIRERRVTVLLKFILMCFIILWLPYSLIVVIAAVCPKCAVPPFMWNLSYWLCYLNSTVNPFCYGFCNENFRRTFIAIITTRWWTKKSRKMLRLGRKPLATKSRVVRQDDFSNTMLRSRRM